MSNPPLTFGAWLRIDIVERRVLSHLARDHTILEIGAGEGALGARLARHHTYVGVEPDAESASRAAARIGGSGRLLQGDASILGPGELFDLVCAFEVLEHIEDDAAAIREWRSHVKPGGRLLLSVPAFHRRFGASDRRVGHYRRYERDDLSGLLAAAGLTGIEVFAYGFPLGYLLDAIRNRIAAQHEEAASAAERTAASGRWLQPPDGAGWLTRSVSLPFRLLQRPFERSNVGIGLVAWGRSPSDG